MDKITARFAVALTEHGHYHVIGADGLSDKEARDEALATVDGEGTVTVYFGEIVLDRPGQIVRAEVVESRED
jgi:hypothetical protein